MGPITTSMNIFFCGWFGWGHLLIISQLFCIIFNLSHLLKYSHVLFFFFKASYFSFKVCDSRALQHNGSISSNT